jgi:ABC-2 type transport system ATP-binding protein
MKVLDLLVFLGEAKGLRRAEARAEALAWLERLGLADWRLRKVDDLSKGMQQKVQFIATVLHRPNLVILDEPFAGLDPVNSQVLKDTVRQLAHAGTSILFSTHVMEQAERLCDSVCIIARGEKVVDGTVSDVKRSHRGRHVVVSVVDGVASIDNLLSDRGLVARSDSYGNYAEVELSDGSDPQVLLERLVRSGAKVTRFEVTEASLHKIFIDRVGPEAAIAAASGQV